MSKATFNQIKQYFQYRNLLNKGKKSFSENNFKNYTSEVTQAYKAGKSLEEYEKNLTNLQNLQSSTPNKFEQTTYNFSGGKSLAEQYEYDRTYSELLQDAQEVFPSTREFVDWKSQLDVASKAGEQLDTFSYSLEMFETLQKAENSPLYESQVDSLVKDNSQFDEFASIAGNMGNDYTLPSYSGTASFTRALEDSNSGGDNALFASNKPEVNYDVEMPQTNRTVLEYENEVLTNREELRNEDGYYRHPSELTTNQEQQQKEVMFKGLVLSCESQQEVDEVVEAFQSEVPMNPDPESGETTDYNGALVENILGEHDLASSEIEPPADCLEQEDVIEFEIKMMKLDFEDMLML